MRLEIILNKLLWFNFNKCIFVNIFKIFNKYNSFWIFYFLLGFYNKRYFS